MLKFEDSEVGQVRIKQFRDEPKTVEFTVQGQVTATFESTAIVEAMRKQPGDTLLPVSYAHGMNVGEIVQDIMERCGILECEIDISGLEGMKVDGFCMKSGLTRDEVKAEIERLKEQVGLPTLNTHLGTALNDAKEGETLKVDLNRPRIREFKTKEEMRDFGLIAYDEADELPSPEDYVHKPANFAILGEKVFDMNTNVITTNLVQAMLEEATGGHGGPLGGIMGWAWVDVEDQGPAFAFVDNKVLGSMYGRVTQIRETAEMTDDLLPSMTRFTIGWRKETGSFVQSLSDVDWAPIEQRILDYLNNEDVLNPFDARGDLKKCKARWMTTLDKRTAKACRYPDPDSHTGGDGTTKKRYKVEVIHGHPRAKLMLMNKRGYVDEIEFPYGGPTGLVDVAMTMLRRCGIDRSEVDISECYADGQDRDERAPKFDRLDFPRLPVTYGATGRTRRGIEGIVTVAKPGWVEEAVTKAMALNHREMLNSKTRKE